MRNVIKICGIRTDEALDAAVGAGADMIGFVFFDQSPRCVTPDEARQLSLRIDGKAKKVALIVDADNARIDGIIQQFAPDWLQLHGKESAERVLDIRQRFGVPILKAVGVADASDLERAANFSAIADAVLLDAKPSPTSDRPGGNGLAFDWALASQFAAHSSNWLLSGGLNPENVETAIRLTKAPGVDVSSGVEDAPGVKSVSKIHAFVRAARLAQDRLGLAEGSV